MIIISEFELPVIVFEILIYEVPVYDLCEILKIGSSQISVVDVVSVFPDVHCQEGSIICLKGVISI